MNNNFGSEGNFNNAEVDFDNPFGIINRIKNDDTILDDTILDDTTLIRNENVEGYGSVDGSPYSSEDEREEDYALSKPAQRNYWKYLILIGAFYSLPSLQFVMFQEQQGNLCYFNNKCKHSLGSIVAFNNVISNIFYIIFGLLFMLLVNVYHSKVSIRTNQNVVNSIDNDPSLYYSLGLVLILEGIFSGIYHVCPSKLNFQFDTSFMFIGTALMFLTLHQKRHKRHISSPFRTYCFMAFIIFMNMLPLTDISTGVETWFWIIIYFMILYISIIGSINIYYGTSWVLNTNLPRNIIRAFRNRDNINYPKLLLITTINVFTISMVIYAQATENILFTNWMLCVFIVNMITYFLYYMINKIKNREPISNKLWMCMFADMIIMMVAIIYYSAAVTDKMESHADSDKLNRPCALFDYWDYHDIWHILSAIGLFFFMIIVYVLDRGLIHTDIRNLPVF